MNYQPVRFAAIYVGILCVMTAIAAAMAYFGFAPPTAVGVISVMIAAMIEGQLAAKGLSEKPTGGLWVISVSMGVTAALISVLLSVGFMIIGLIDLQVLASLGAAGWAVIVAIVLILSILMARLGIGIGVKAAINTAKPGK